MSETVSLHGSLEGKLIPAHTVVTVLQGFVDNVHEYDFSDYRTGVPCHDHDLYWLADYHLTVWEDYHFEGDDYSVCLEDRVRRRLLDPSEQALVLYATSDRLATIQMVTAGELFSLMQQHSYVVVATR